MSDETKACPNPECEDGKIKSAWFRDLGVCEAWFFCAACKLSGPRTKASDLDAVIAEARRLWNALPRATGPGDATRSVLAGLAEHLEDHDGAVTMEAWVVVGELEAALRECGMEAGS